MAQNSEQLTALRDIEEHCYHIVNDVNGVLPRALVEELYATRRALGLTYDPANHKYHPWPEA